MARVGSQHAWVLRGLVLLGRRESRNIHGDAVHRECSRVRGYRAYGAGASYAAILSIPVRQDDGWPRLPSRSAQASRVRSTPRGATVMAGVIRVDLHIQ